MRMRWVSALVVAGMAMVCAGGAVAGELVMVSSAVYQGVRGDVANCVATDASGNIFVAGDRFDGSTGNFCVVKYDQNLRYCAMATCGFGYGDAATGIAIDTAGNVFATVGGVNDFCTVKYDNNLNFISSATFDAGGADNATAVAVDVNGNVFVTGNTNNNYCTAKYNNDLQLISSVTYSGGGASYAYGITTDAANNVFVTGHSNNPGGAGQEYLTTKFDNDLRVLATARSYSGYNSPSSGMLVGATFNGIKTDRAGNVFVTGYQCINPTPESNPYACRQTGYTVKYDNDLHVVSSATTNCGRTDQFQSVAVDKAGNVIVTGFSQVNNYYDYITVAYDNDLHLVSSATTFNSGKNEFGLGGAITADNDIIVTGYRAASPNEFVTIKYFIAPVISSVTPSIGDLSGGTTVTISGNGFGSDAAVSIGGIAAADVVYVSPLSITAVTPPGASAGAKDVTVCSRGFQSTLKAGFAYAEVTSSTGTFDPAAGGTATIHLLSGDITVDAPAGAFSSAVTLRIAAVPVPSSNLTAAHATNLGIEITNSAGLQPDQAITITLRYRDSDIAGFDESELTIARYDNGRWIPIPTVAYPDENKLVGTVRHLSTFAVIQLVPAADPVVSVLSYPNPYNPKNGIFTFEKLTGNGEIRIYTLAGELVRRIAYSAAEGRATWDGKNDGGKSVASGVYLARIKSPAGTKKLKIAVEK